MRGYLTIATIIVGIALIWNTVHSATATKLHSNKTQVDAICAGIR